MHNRIAWTILLSCSVADPALPQKTTLAFARDVVIETGDTWLRGGQKYRLYGVQACIRGTGFTDPSGRSADCGEYSIASLAALFATETVACQPVGTARDSAAFVICAVRVDETDIDVGTALIASGAAFAAIHPSAAVVVPAYLVAELSAKEQHQGLWSGRFEHPAEILLKGDGNKL